MACAGTGRGYLSPWTRLILFLWVTVCLHHWSVLTDPLQPLKQAPAVVGGIRVVAWQERGTEERKSQADSLCGWVCREMHCLTWAPPVAWLTSATIPFVITQALQKLPATSAMWQWTVSSKYPALPWCQPMGPGLQRWLGHPLPMLAPVSSPLFLDEEDPGLWGSGVHCVHGHPVPAMSFWMKGSGSLPIEVNRT